MVLHYEMPLHTLRSLFCDISRARVSGFISAVEMKERNVQIHINAPTPTYRDSPRKSNKSNREWMFLICVDVVWGGKFF